MLYTKKSEHFSTSEKKDILFSLSESAITYSRRASRLVRDLLVLSLLETGITHQKHHL